MEELEYKIIRDIENDGRIVFSIIPVGIIIIIAFLILCK